MKAVIFANGAAGDDPEALECCRNADLVIAVDGGLGHCHRLGIQPQVLLGDLDSAPAELIRRAEDAGVELLRYPAAKDKTDLELALELAARRGVGKVFLFAALGGRRDMHLANIFLITAPGYRQMRITIHDHRAWMQLLRDREQLELEAAAGSTVSLLPLAGPVRGVCLEGFQYPLQGQTLDFGSTRGLSNILLGNRGRITIDQGLLLVIVARQTTMEAE